jgi:ATP-dependent Lon protease
MDIDYKASDSGAEDDARSGEIVRATDVLPAEIHLLPQSSRPFFPGQVMPLLVDTRWEETLLAVKEAKHDIIGLALVHTDSVDDADAGDFYDMGTACRVHRVQKDEGKLQVLVEGLQRFRIERWTSKQPPFRARVRYYPETEYKHVAEVKAYAVAIINTIKELVPLNPLYGEELKIFLEHFRARS